MHGPRTERVRLSQRAGALTLGSILVNGPATSAPTTGLNFWFSTGPVNMCVHQPHRVIASLDAFFLRPTEFATRSPRCHSPKSSQPLSPSPFRAAFEVTPHLVPARFLAPQHPDAPLSRLRFPPGPDPGLAYGLSPTPPRPPPHHFHPLRWATHHHHHDC